MARLTIVVEVPDADPTLNDPHEVADEVLDLLGDGWTTPPEFVGAEWGDHLPDAADVMTDEADAAQIRAASPIPEPGTGWAG
jgi:hypothetical protein